MPSMHGKPNTRACGCGGEGGNVGELNCIRGEVYGVECEGQYGHLYPTTVRQRRLVGIRCQPWKTRPRCRVRGTGGWLFPHNLMALAFFNVASAFPELKALLCYTIVRCLWQ